jgi:hypothetical protein
MATSVGWKGSTAESVDPAARSPLPEGPVGRAACPAAPRVRGHEPGDLSSGRRVCGKRTRVHRGPISGSAGSCRIRPALEERARDESCAGRDEQIAAPFLRCELGFPRSGWDPHAEDRSEK